MTTSPDNFWTATFSGKPVGLHYGAPSIFDVAVALCREARFAGNTIRWYPVGLHCFVVADRLPVNLKLYGLLHDASEALTGDIPRGFKTDQQKRTEQRLLEVFFDAWGIGQPSETEWEEVKQADDAALHGEVHTICSTVLREKYSERVPETEVLTRKYIEKYPPLECIEPSGMAVLEFIRRFHEYKDFVI